MNFRLPLWFVIFAFIICIPSAALGSTYSVRAQNGDVITLHEQPCSQSSDWFKSWKKAVFQYQGKTYDACWRLIGQHIVVLDADGDISNVPMQMFRKDETI